MVITKTPMRISLAGGGSDISTFYKEYGGCVLSTSINKYIYITIHPYFDEKKISLKYSKNELVANYSEIQHRYLRYILEKKGIMGVEISSTADVPSGTGLGSSSSFTVGLLNSLYSYMGKKVTKEDLAAESCKIEIDYLGNPIGKQDQYAAAYGGLNFITFHSDEKVSVDPLSVDFLTLKELKDNLVMYYTGLTHDSGVILSKQRECLKRYDRIVNMKRICKCAYEMKECIENNQIDIVGDILDETWKLKREMASNITNPIIDNLYNCAIANGARGGKLLGAGGGGFMLFYCPKDKQEHLSRKLGLKCFNFEFDNEGTSIIYLENHCVRE